MTDRLETHDNTESAAASRTALWLVYAGFAMMALAGGLMWLKFGPSMFMDLVTAAMNCF